MVRPSASTISTTCPAASNPTTLPVTSPVRRVVTLGHSAADADRATAIETTKRKGLTSSPVMLDLETYSSVVPSVCQFYFLSLERHRNIQMQTAAATIAATTSPTSADG